MHFPLLTRYPSMPRFKPIIGPSPRAHCGRVSVRVVTVSPITLAPALVFAVQSHVGGSEDIGKKFSRPPSADAITAENDVDDLVSVGPLAGLVPGTNLDVVADEHVQALCRRFGRVVVHRSATSHARDPKVRRLRRFSSPEGSCAGTS